MASLESLPPDQRAVLELVLRRGRSYDEIAELLAVDRAGVRERALAALDALGPRTRVPAERRALITDYLLGALPSAVARQVHDRLAESASERAWARVVGSELAPLASDPLPEIPGEAPSNAPAPAPARARQRPRPQPGTTRPTSRRGGAVLLGLLGIAIVVVIVVLVAGGGSSKHSPSTQSGAASTPASTGSSTSSTPATTSTSSQVLAQINLNPPAGGSAKGIAEVLRENGKIGIAIIATGLTPNTKRPPNAYAVWLYNSASDSHILGFVNPGVGKSGRLQTAGGLPPNAAHYQKLLVTIETQSNPKTPGTPVLEGTLKLG